MSRQRLIAGVSRSSFRNRSETPSRLSEGCCNRCTAFIAAPASSIATAHRPGENFPLKTKDERLSNWALAILPGTTRRVSGTAFVSMPSVSKIQAATFACRGSQNSWNCKIAGGIPAPASIFLRSTEDIVNLYGVCVNLLVNEAELVEESLSDSRQPRMFPTQ